VDKKGITFSDPSGALQSLHEPFGFLFIFLQFLQKAGFLRNYGKINNPASGGVHSSFAERGALEPPSLTS
jgi:hypothetical protein